VAIKDSRYQTDIQPEAHLSRRRACVLLNKCWQHPHTFGFCKEGYGSVVKSQYLLPIPIGIAYQSQGNSSVFSGNPTQYQGGQYLGRNWQFSAALRLISESFPIGRRRSLACSDWLEIYGLRSSIPCLFRYPLLQHHDYPTIHPCCRWLLVTVYTIYRSF
jgi:hypothetical protein